MIQKLEALGIHNISFEEISDAAKTKALGRPHLAAALVEKKIVGNMRAAFDKYLAEGAPAYVPKFKQTPKRRSSLIKGLGGIVVLAHPMLTNVDELILVSLPRDWADWKRIIPIVRLTSCVFMKIWPGNII